MKLPPVGLPVKVTALADLQYAVFKPVIETTGKALIATVCEVVLLQPLPSEYV